MTSWNLYSLQFYSVLLMTSDEGLAWFGIDFSVFLVFHTTLQPWSFYEFPPFSVLPNCAIPPKVLEEARAWTKSISDCISNGMDGSNCSMFMGTQEDPLNATPLEIRPYCLQKMMTQWGDSSVQSLVIEPQEVGLYGHRIGMFVPQRCPSTGRQGLLAPASTCLRD